jgi:glycosyltransferase involved in cell wall biosynthesis
VARVEDSWHTIGLFQADMGAYRQAFLEQLIDHFGPSFRLYMGGERVDGVLNIKVHVGDHLTLIRNRYLIGRRLLWQHGAIGPALAEGVVILECNPRNLTVWLILVLRAIRGRPSLLWGHAWSRRGRGSPSNGLRAIIRWLSDGFIAYTATEASEIGTSWPKRPVHAAPNALYRRSEMRAAVDGTPCDFLYVGRLIREKKPGLFLEAFERALPELPISARAIIIGEGPERAALQARAANLPADRVIFAGRIVDSSRLFKYYSSALASVSPGTVGLTLTQSLGFGVPMIAARDEPHGPEMEATVPGWNTILFSPSTAEALADAMLALMRDAPEWLSRRTDISEACSREYSAERMASGFIAAVTTVLTPDEVPS